MLAVFYLTFNVIGAGLQDLLALGIEWITDITDKALTAAGVNEVFAQSCDRWDFCRSGKCFKLSAYNCDAVFLPPHLWRDSGYIARVAFLWTNYLERSDFQEEA